MLNTKWTVQCEAEESDFFKTDAEVPQGDSSSTNEFTLYLLRELCKENDGHMCKKFMIITSSELSSIPKHDHSKDIDKHFDIHQEYALYISAITTDKNKICYIKKTVGSELETWNFKVNKRTTEKYEIKSNGNESWNKCKLLGSQLEMDKDISWTWRKSLAIALTSKLKYIFYYQKLPVGTKTGVFNWHVASKFFM